MSIQIKNRRKLFPYLEVSATGISKDEFIDNLAKDILDKIPVEYDINKVRKSFGPTVTPTSIVLLQELERFNKLISMMKRSLIQLRKVCIDENVLLYSYNIFQIL